MKRKTILGIIIALITFGLVILITIDALHEKHTSLPEIEMFSKNHEETTTPNTITDGTYCFQRIQKATTEAPYESDEHIKITVSGNEVAGTKNGTQSGPGVSNGFTGTLKGMRNGTQIELLYSYIVEGSNGKETEIYNFENNSLVKSNWPLEEKNHILVPTKVGTPTLLTYTSEVCAK